MQTGEGKTLAAVLPAALNALGGDGVHVLTFNDYLARRDADWMRPLYQALGLSVAFVQEGMPPAARRRAYAADVTYVTAKEAGFDHLRDLLRETARGRGAPGLSLRADRRGGLDSDRRGAGPAGHRRIGGAAGRVLADRLAAGGRAPRRACTTTATSTAATSS